MSESRLAWLFALFTISTCVYYGYLLFFGNEHLDWLVLTALAFLQSAGLIYFATPIN